MSSGQSIQLSLPASREPINLSKLSLPDWTRTYSILVNTLFKSYIGQPTSLSISYDDMPVICVSKKKMMILTTSLSIDAWYFHVVILYSRKWTMVSLNGLKLSSADVRMSTWPFVITLNNLSVSQYWVKSNNSVYYLFVLSFADGL